MFSTKASISLPIRWTAWQGRLACLISAASAMMILRPCSTRR